MNLNKRKNISTLQKTFEGKKILVTGGTGSIGGEIVRQLLKYNPNVIRILSNDENSLFNFEQELKGKRNLRFLYGDIREMYRVKRAIEDIDIVFHAAALKHVPLCEYNPFEAIKTNVLGTQNVIEASLDEEIEKMITISTDKAVNPISTMGATKLLAERITIDANYYSGKRKTIFSCVRFGNVIASRGSVLPLFEDQIKSGGPVTITSPNMTRFVMSIDQSINLVLKAVTMMKGGEIFVLKAMDCLKIDDLAEVMIEALAPKYGYRPHDIKREYTGIRPGEKLYESLMSEEEGKDVLETEDMYIILPKVGVPLVKIDKHSYPLVGTPKDKKYSSSEGKLLTKEEIKNLLKNICFI